MKSYKSYNVLLATELTRATLITQLIFIFTEVFGLGSWVGDQQLTSSYSLMYVFAIILAAILFCLFPSIPCSLFSFVISSKPVVGVVLIVRRAEDLGVGWL
jgi:hypothetical protein